MGSDKQVGRRTDVAFAYIYMDGLLPCWVRMNDFLINSVSFAAICLFAGILLVIGEKIAIKLSPWWGISFICLVLSVVVGLASMHGI